MTWLCFQLEPETVSCPLWTLSRHMCDKFVMAFRSRDGRRHYDSNSSDGDGDAEYSEPDEKRKTCIKRTR